MSVSDNNKNRGAHGDSSSMLGRLRPSSENPPALAVWSVNKTTRTILCVCTALYVGLVIWTIAERNAAQREAERIKFQYNEVCTLSHKYKSERDNAVELAKQYKAEYQQAVFEIAELKSQNEELTRQIDILREPPADAYNEIGWDFDYVVRVVGAEARVEPIDGILAVCQCIQDTVERTGQTPEQVVKSGQYTSPVSRAVTDNMETVNECCLLVFLNGYKPYAEPIEYFYAFRNGYSAWHESQVFCYEIGGHRYFKAVGA